MSGELPIYDINKTTYKYYNGCKVLFKSTQRNRIAIPLFEISTYKEASIINKCCDIDEQIANDIVFQECELLLNLITYNTVIKNACSGKVDYKLILNNNDMNNLFEDGYAISINNLERFIFVIQQDVQVLPCDDIVNRKKGFTGYEVIGMMINDDIEVSKFKELRINKFEILMGV
jgi:hypothetical protein